MGRVEFIGRQRPEFVSRVNETPSEKSEQSVKEDYEPGQNNGRIVPKGFFIVAGLLFVLGIGLGKLSFFIWGYRPLRDKYGNIEYSGKRDKPQHSIVSVRQEPPQ